MKFRTKFASPEVERFTVHVTIMAWITQKFHCNHTRIPEILLQGGGCSKHKLKLLTKLKCEEDVFSAFLIIFSKDVKYLLLTQVYLAGVSEDALKEFSMMFKHFDKDKSGKLNHQEFKSCLRALGYDLPMVEEGQPDPEFNAILGKYRLIGKCGKKQI